MSEQSSSSSFYFKWKSFLLGVIFGVIGVIITLFTKEDKRDKMYSSLLGCAIGTALNIYLLKHGL